MRNPRSSFVVTRRAFSFLVVVLCMILWQLFQSLQVDNNNYDNYSSVQKTQSNPDVVNRSDVRTIGDSTTETIGILSSSSLETAQGFLSLRTLKRKSRAMCRHHANTKEEDALSTATVGSSGNQTLVALFPNNCTRSNMICGEWSHFLLDGLDNSDCFQRTNDYLEAPIWLVDTLRATSKDMMMFFQEKLVHSTTSIAQQNSNHTLAEVAAASPTALLTIYHVDYGDQPALTMDFDYVTSLDGHMTFHAEKKNKSTSTTTIVFRNAKNNSTADDISDHEVFISSLHYYKRSIVENRNMQKSQLGSVRNYTYRVTQNKIMPVYHISYGIRTDIVQATNARTLELLFANNTRNVSSNVAVTTTTTDAERITTIATALSLSPIHPSIVEPWRINGVRSFWPTHTSDVSCNLDCQRRGQYRCLVSHTLLEHITAEALLEVTNSTNISNFTESYAPNAPTLVKVGFAGASGVSGRNIAQKAYIQDLISYKIIVVCQRDMWEGHYRLMEAMAGGGLVLHDVMLNPPSQLVDGVHYVTYHSMQDLVRKVLYYLIHEGERRVIADRGWIQVMTFYRSWNLVEAMLMDHLTTIR